MTIHIYCNIIKLIEDVQLPTQKPKVLLQKEIESLSQELGFVNYKLESEHGKRLNWFNSVRNEELFFVCQLYQPSFLLNISGVF